ncbi:MAG: ATP-binding protein [Pseudomonadota bacterium]
MQFELGNASESCPLCPAEPAVFETALIATQDRVRTTTLALRARLDQLGVSPSVLGNVELAAAEALNNIAEHAYSGTPPGPIRVSAYFERSHLLLRIVDAGHPLPDATLPSVRLPDPSGPLADLPEGGFGWYLITQLSDAVRYDRCRDLNILDICFRCDLCDSD